MNKMFFDSHKVNQNLTQWDVSKVEVVHWMFYYAENFNGDISRCKVANVTTMETMFSGAFNSDISRWYVAKVKEMNSMFGDAKDFNGDTSRWNVTKVTNMVIWIIWSTAPRTSTAISPAGTLQR